MARMKRKSWHDNGLLVLSPFLHPVDVRISAVCDGLVAQSHGFQLVDWGCESDGPFSRQGPAMARPSTTLALVRKPDSVLFGELAIAAGLAGHPIAVCFSESTATVICQIWKYLAQFAGAEQVLHVHSQADVRKLTEDVGLWRLIVVHTPRLFNTVAWTVQMHDSGEALPTIFFRWTLNTVDDAPIPILVLRNTPDESSSIVRWLTAGCPQRATLPPAQPTPNITFDPALVAVTMPAHPPNGRGLLKHQDCQLLAALLAGSCLTRNTEPLPAPPDLPICGQRAYERVRCLLQSPLVSTTNEQVDQLAIDMVSRANVFLELKSNAEFINAHPSFCDAGDPLHRQRGNRTRQELVSRREVADLGNVRCRLIQQMVEFLQTAEDGHSIFRRMGLVRRPPSELDFRRIEPRTLAMMLRRWSPKQVRTHFDALRKSGWITGERESENAPWQYRLPEELAMDALPFRSLAPANELFSEANSST